MKIQGRAKRARRAMQAACLGIALSLAPFAFAGQHGSAPHSAPRPTAPRMPSRAPAQPQYRPGGNYGQRPPQGNRVPPAAQRSYPDSRSNPASRPYARPGYSSGGPQGGYRQTVPGQVRPGGVPSGSARPTFVQRPNTVPNAAPSPAGNANRGYSPEARPTPNAGAPAGNISSARPAYTGGGNSLRPTPRSGHLPQWLDQHKNLPAGQQEQLLRQEPSFRRLNPGEQQKVVQQLHRMDQLPEAQRDRRLARAENLERLSPNDRARVTQSAQQMKAMPPDRQVMMRRAFRDLRGVPLDQRETVLNSGRYSNAFSPEERGVLSNLLRVEPYEAPH